MAYNWGAAGRRAGLLPHQLIPGEGDPARRQLDGRELDALSRLGPDAWERWALKGWAETAPPGGPG